MPSLFSFAGTLIADVTGGLSEALPYLSSFVEKGLSANAALRELTGLGFSYRRQSALSVFRQLSGLKASRNYVKSVPNKYLPNPDQIPFAGTLTRGNYSYRVRVDSINTATGESISRYLTVSSNTLISKQQALDVADGIIGENLVKYEETITGTVVDQITKRPVGGMAP